MTASQLKAAIESRGSDSHFFTRKTMQFFGDTMRNYGVCSATVETRDGAVECWELFRKRPVKHGLRDSAYFSKDTLERVYPVR